MQHFERERDLRAWERPEKRMKGHSGTIRGRVIEMRVEEVWSGDQQEAGGPPEKKSLVFIITQSDRGHRVNRDTGKFSHFFLSIKK